MHNRGVCHPRRAEVGSVYTMKMNKQPSRNLDGLDLDLNRKIDAIYRLFESDRRDGRQAPVDVYLADILDEGRGSAAG
jgi:hypothetical protein